MEKSKGTERDLTVIEKVRKLLEFSIENGATESEVENAIKLAQRLMMKHNLKEANLICKQINELDYDISELDTLVSELDLDTQTEPDKMEQNTVELKISGRVSVTHFSTIYHTFTYSDIKTMAHTRKDILVQKRRELLNQLEEL